MDDDRLLGEQNVLVIEDEPEAQLIIKDLLTESLPDCRITLSGDGKDGLRKASANQYDLICTDYRMPETNGAEFINQTKTNKAALNYKTPVVVISGFMGMIKDDLLCDFNNIFFLEKPYSPEKLRLVATTAALSRDTGMVELNQKVIDYESLASLGELSHSMICELNTPLSIVQGHSKIIRKKLETEYPDPFCNIRDNLNLIDQYTSKISNITKLYNSVNIKTEEHFEPFLLTDLLDSTVFRRFEESYRDILTLTLDTSEEEIRVTGSWHHLEFSLFNFLLYSKESILRSGTGKTGKIKIKTRPRGDNVSILITNNVTSFSGSERRLPGWFHSRSRPSPGNRNNLAVVRAKKIIENHAGSVIFPPESFPEEWVEIVLPVTWPEMAG